jgi:GDP-D-mannose 3', 5'-epimerase
VAIVRGAPLETSDLVLVTGAGGFIGGHVVAELRRRGFERIRAVDIKPGSAWHQQFPDVDNRVLDLREKDACLTSAAGARTIVNLASDMGGMGFIETNKALCMLSVLINTQLLAAAVEFGAETFLFASSACVYAAGKQTDPNVAALKESDVYPALPEDGYGWEKLFGERLCRHFMEDFGLSVRVPRFHNVYGPHGTWDGGREKAPAAICRKVIEAKLDGRNQIEIWGDGRQTRSFTYIDDAVDGIFRLLQSDCTDPVNIGSSELFTIDSLVDLVEVIAGVRLERRYDLSAPQGVRGRNSDNTHVLERLGWEPTTPLHMGMAKTYSWIEQQVARTAYAPMAAAAAGSA